MLAWGCERSSVGAKKRPGVITEGYGSTEPYGPTEGYGSIPNPTGRFRRVEWNFSFQDHP